MKANKNILLEICPTLPEDCENIIWRMKHEMELTESLKFIGRWGHNILYVPLTLYSMYLLYSTHGSAETQRSGGSKGWIGALRKLLGI